jgi:multiple sugar transport system substrate-binding protein
MAGWAMGVCSPGELQEEETMSMNFIKPTRRQFLAGSAALSAASITGMKPAFANVDWKKYAGTTLEVNLIKSPRGDILQKYQKEFEN